MKKRAAWLVRIFFSFFLCSCCGRVSVMNIHLHTYTKGEWVRKQETARLNVSFSFMPKRIYEWSKSRSWKRMKKQTFPLPSFYSSLLPVCMRAIFIHFIIIFQESFIILCRKPSSHPPTCEIPTQNVYHAYIK